MNEVYGISPKAFSSASELRVLFSTFGPHSGRYVLTYPEFQIWKSHLVKIFDSAGDVERERLKLAIARARDNCSLIDKRGLPWEEKDSWIVNAFRVLQTNGGINKIYSSEDEFEELIKLGADIFNSVIKSSEPELFGALDMQVETSPESYWNASKILCMLSNKVFIVDPYFNPLKSQWKPIFKKFISELSKLKKITEIFFFVRHDNMATSSGYSDVKSIETLIRSELDKARKNFRIVFNMIDDRTSKNKLHARYLFTDKGGLKFDQGFQILPNERNNIIAPIGVRLHESLYREFTNNSSDFKIIAKVDFSI